MTGTELHLGITALLFLLFVGCVVKSVNPDSSKWWMGLMLVFLAAAAFAAGWTGYT